MEAIILAGGYGTRLRSEVSDVPKPLAPVCGTPFLSFQLDFLAEAGVKRVILSTGYKKEAIRKYYGETWRQLKISYSEECAPLGTGGAVIKALQELKNKKCSIVMNGDTYFPISIDNLLSFHSQAHADISIALFKSDNHSRYSGFAVDPIKRLITYLNPNSEYKSGGIYVFGEPVIDWLLKQKIRNMSFETDLTPGFFARGMKIGAYTETVQFLDIGLPDDYRFAQQHLATVADQKFGGS